MNIIHKLLLLMATLTIAVGCENKCDEDDFIGFKMTQDKFFYITKIFATKVDDVSKVDAIVKSDKAIITAFGNNFKVTTTNKSTQSYHSEDSHDTKNSPLWMFTFFNIESFYPEDYEVACGLELCCYACVGIESMFFDNTNEYKPKIDSSNLNHWYVYYDNNWWQWDVTKTGINWGSLIPTPTE